MNFWQPDKIKHLKIATVGAYVLNIILFILIGAIADAITILAGLAAIIGWEFLPKRTFSVGDMGAGTLGLIAGMILAKMTLIIGYLIIT